MAYRRAFRKPLRYASYAALYICADYAVQHHFLEIVSINGRSMNPSLSPTIHETGAKDYVLAKKWSPMKGLEAGDLVLFRCPYRPETLVVKRVIALGGDTVILDPKRRPGYGHDLEELRPEDMAAAKRWNTYHGKVLVPYGHVWVEGDNRGHSCDSNDYGPVSRSLVLGRLLMTVWPLNMCFKRPWEDYKSMTKTLPGTEVRLPVWLE